RCRARLSLCGQRVGHQPRRGHRPHNHHGQGIAGRIHRRRHPAKRQHLYPTHYWYTDMTKFTATNGTQTQNLTDTINIADQSGLSFSTTLPAGVVGQSYTGSVTVSRQPHTSGTMTISVDPGNPLPDGLSLGSTVDNHDNSFTADVTGSPTTEGSSNPKFNATDGVQSGSKTVSMGVAAAPSISIE